MSRFRLQRGKPVAPEQAIVRQILEFLWAHDAMAWRNNTGAMSGQHKGKRWYVRFSEPGAPDIFALLRGGRFLAVEVKAQDGKLRPAQEAWIAQARELGHMVIVAHSAQDLVGYV